MSSPCRSEELSLETDTYFMIGNPAVSRIRGRALFLTALPVLALSGCGFLPPTPSDAHYDVAERAANSICGPDNWTLENTSNHPFGASPMFSLTATCIKNPNLDFTDYPEALAAAFGVPVDTITVSGNNEPPALNYAYVRDETYEQPWNGATLYDLNSYPGASDGEPGEGPMLSIGGRPETKSQ